MPRNAPLPPDSLPEQEYFPPRKPKPRPASPLPPVWSILLTVFGALSLAACLIVVLLAMGGRSIPRDPGKPLILITAAPSPTSALAELLEPTATLDLGSTPPPVSSISLTGPTLVPTASATFTPIAVSPGVQIIIISQGGINVRSAPGMGSAVNFTANNNETFTVIGGPEVVDGLVWWQIGDPFNNARIGWVAENDGIADLIQVFVP